MINFIYYCKVLQMNVMGIMNTYEELKCYFHGVSATSIDLK